MNGFLDQLLKTGQSAIADVTRGDQRGTFVKGAAAGGVLGLLLGTRSGRRMGGTALKYGSVAALGMLAYKAYTNWQAEQARQTGATGATPAPVRTIDRLPAPQADQHAQAMLKAMIAAAKSDGHLDERERERVGAELDRMGADATLRRWVDDEIRRPIDPADVAAGATTPELAAEIYLASLVMVDETTPMERAYLDQLAAALRLDAGLKRQLESQLVAG